MPVPRSVVFKDMKEKGWPFWDIKLAAGQIISSDQNNRDINSQINKLKENLEEVGRSQQIVEVSYSCKNRKEKAKGNSKADGNTLPVDLWAEEGARISGFHAQPIQQYNVQPNMTDNDLTKKIDIEVKIAQFELRQLHALELAEKDKQIAELEEVIADLEEQLEGKQSKTGLNGIIDQYAPTLLPLLISKLGGVPASSAMAGVAVEDLKEEKSEQRIKAAKAVSKLLAVDEMAGDNLIMLAEFATLSPESYKSFIPILQGQLAMLKNK
jgi:hypothetical protein